MVGSGTIPHLIFTPEKAGEPVGSRFLANRAIEVKSNGFVVTFNDIPDLLSKVHAAGDLCVFLEAEIGYRFDRQMVNIQEKGLSDRIDRLYETGTIAEKTTKDAQVWRRTLNPSHHTLDWIRHRASA